MEDMKKQTTDSMIQSVVTTPTKKEITKAQQLKNYLRNEECMDSLIHMLGESEAHRFSQNIISLYTNPASVIKNCSPASIIHSAMVGAYTNLSFVPDLGQAALIPYGDKATFQVMKNGLINLAHRTNTLRRISCNPYYAGDIKFEDKFRGIIEFNYDNTNKDILEGFIAFAQLSNGFECYVKMTIDELVEHGKRYSKSYGRGLWVDPVGKYYMYAKTVLKKLIKHNIPIQQYEPEHAKLALALKFDQSVPTTINITEADAEYPDALLIDDIIEEDIKNQISSAIPNEYVK